LYQKNEIEQPKEKGIFQSSEWAQKYNQNMLKQRSLKKKYQNAKALEEKLLANPKTRQQVLKRKQRQAKEQELFRKQIRENNLKVHQQNEAKKVMDQTVFKNEFFDHLLNTLNQPSLPLPSTLANSWDNYLEYAQNVKENGVIHSTLPVLTNVHTVFHGSKVLLSLRGGSSLLFSPSFIFSLIFSILGFIDLIRKTKKTIDGVKDILSDREEEESNSKTKKRLPNFWMLLETTKNPIVLSIVGMFILWTMKNNPNILPETVTAPFGIQRKRTWKEYFRGYTDFRTPKPYILLFSGGIIFIGYRNGKSILTFFKEKQPMTVMFEGIFAIVHKQFDAYKELGVGLFKSQSEIYQKTAESNEQYLTRTVKDLEESKVKFNKITEQFTTLVEKNAECNTQLSISHLNNTYCAGKANQYGTLSYYLEKEKRLLQKVHQHLLTQIREVTSKLYAHDSKALTIPGQSQTLPQFLEAIVKEAKKKLEEINDNLQNTKIPETFELYPLPESKKK